MEKIHWKSLKVDELDVGAFEILSGATHEYQALDVSRYYHYTNILVSGLELVCILLLLLALASHNPHPLLLIASLLTLSVSISTLSNMYIVVKDKKHGKSVGAESGVKIEKILFVKNFGHSSALCVLICKLALALKYCLSFYRVMVNTVHSSMFSQEILTENVSLTEFSDAASLDYLVILVFFVCETGSKYFGAPLSTHVERFLARFSYFDAIILVIYLAICRHVEIDDDFAHFSMLLRKFPLVYLLLACGRFFFGLCALIEINDKSDESMNYRYPRLATHFFVFFFSMIFFFSFSKRPDQSFYLFAIIAFFERSALMFFNVDLLRQRVKGSVKTQKDEENRVVSMESSSNSVIPTLKVVLKDTDASSCETTRNPLSIVTRSDRALNMCRS